jgi:hypothetical protein
VRIDLRIALKEKFESASHIHPVTRLVRMKISTTAVVLVVALGAFACGGTASSGGTNVSTSSAFLTQLCDAFTPCCSATGKQGDTNKCAAAYGVLTDGMKYDATAASKCLDEVHAASANPAFCTGGGSPTPSCKSVFVDGPGVNGTKAPGDACNESSDCAASSEGNVTCLSSYTTNGTDSSETRICQLQIDGNEGDAPCIGTKDGNVSFGDASSSPPAKGYVCDLAKGVGCSSKTHACTKIPVTGEPCATDSGTSPCAATAYCDLATSTCVDRVAIGASCEKATCADQGYCEKSTKQCTAVHAAGEACETSEQCGHEASCTNGACESFQAFQLGLELVCR